MSPTTVFENEFITVQYNPDKKMIHHTVHKPIDLQLLAEAMWAGAEALKQYGATKWLSDDRQNGPLTNEAFGEEANAWRRTVVANGWKYWAIVVPQSLESAGSLEPTIEALYDFGLRMMVFSTLEAAIAWLDKF